MNLTENNGIQEIKASKSIVANFGGFQIIMESLITITCYQGSRIIVFKSRIGFSSPLYCVR